MIQVVVESSFSQQFLVGALFNNITFIHHQNLVGIFNRRQTMSNDKTGAVLQQATHGALNEQLGTSIDRTGRLVQNENLRVADESTGNGEQLLLPLRNIGAFFVEHGLVAIGQGANKVIRKCSFGGCYHFFLAGSLASIGNVGHNRVVIQPGVLQNHTKLVAQFFTGYTGNIDAIHGDLSGIHFVKAHEQVHKGGFAGSGGTHNGNHLSGSDIDVKVVNNGFAGTVTKPHMIDDHMSLHRLWQGSGGGFLRHFFFVEQLKDPFGCGHSRLQDVGNLGCLGNGLVELANVLQEALNFANRNLPAHGKVTTKQAYRYIP